MDSNKKDVTCRSSLNMMQDDVEVSPSSLQATECKGLTKDPSSGSQNKERELVLSLFLELQNVPDFMAIVERWSELSEEVKQVIVRLVK